MSEALHLILSLYLESILCLIISSGHRIAKSNRPAGTVEYFHECQRYVVHTQYGYVYETELNDLFTIYKTSGTVSCSVTESPISTPFC